jgi:hypothetical protein
MDKLDSVLSALKELAAAYESEVLRNFQRNHLTEEDHRIIRRGFAKWEATRNLTLAEQVIVVKREVKDEQKVLGLRVQDDVARSRSKPVSRKKSTVPTTDNTDALSQLHSHIDSLRKGRDKSGAE